MHDRLVWRFGRLLIRVASGAAEGCRIRERDFEQAARHPSVSRATNQDRLAP
jgi:hypothetical protein